MGMTETDTQTHLWVWTFSYECHEQRCILVLGVGEDRRGTQSAFGMAGLQAFAAIHSTSITLLLAAFPLRHDATLGVLLNHVTAFESHRCVPPGAICLLTNTAHKTPTNEPGSRPL